MSILRPGVVEQHKTHSKLSLKLKFVSLYSVVAFDTKMFRHNKYSTGYEETFTQYLEPSNNILARSDITSTGHEETFTQYLEPSNNILTHSDITSTGHEETFTQYLEPSNNILAPLCLCSCISLASNNLHV